MAYGAYLAAKSLRRDVEIIGIDGLFGDHRGLDLVAKGILDCTFICPTGGKEAITYAVDILNNETGIPKKTILPSYQVTQDNIEMYQSAMYKDIIHCKRSQLKIK